MRLTPFLLLVSAFCLSAADSDFNGRWDIRVTDEARNRAWWLEVTGAGTPNPQGRFVGAPGGNMDPIPEIAVQNGVLTFAFNRGYSTPQGEVKRGVYKARFSSGKLEGTFHAGSLTEKWIGIRAPEIKDADDGSWHEGAAIQLFNGKDTSGWLPIVPGKPLGWTVKSGILTNVAGANNLMTARKFWNFKLHVEFRMGEHSNSGIGLRGRYEVQILDDFGRTPNTHSNGALYSRIPPSVNASRKPGEWQTYDVRLVGRHVTIVLNGTKVVEGQIEGLTAIATDWDESKPGPLTIQGDHGSVELRAVTLTPLVH